MNVALGGDDPQLADWGRQLTACGSRVAAPGDLPDAAVLGGSAVAVLAAARNVGEATPLYIVPNAVSAAEVAYALLPQVEDGRLVVPGWSQRCTAAVRDCLERFTRGDLGDLRLLRLERTQPLPGAAAGLLPQAEIDAAFFEDIDLLRLLGGDYNRLTAIQIGAEAAGVRQATVTLAADGAPEAVWSMIPGPAAHWSLQVTGTKASAVLRMQGAGGMELFLDEHPVPLADDDPRQESLRRFLGDVEVRPGPEVLDPGRPRWEDYVRAADLLQGLHRSLRRRRTIDLHFESVSERSQFKTQMTAVGCGVLTWALLGTCLGLLLGRLLDPRDATERRAAAAGTIVWAHEFTGDQIAPATLARLVRQVENDGAETVILVERAGEANTSAIDSDRLQSLTQALQEAAGGRLIPQVEVRPLAGGWFRWGMLAVWCLAFGPLALYLALQLLLGITRPA